MTLHIIVYNQVDITYQEIQYHCAKCERTIGLNFEFLLHAFQRVVYCEQKFHTFVNRRG